MYLKRAFENPALTQQMLYFDPFYGVKRPDGKPETRTQGLEDRPGISITEDGKVRVLYYAPNASSVAIVGIGGSMEGSFPLQKMEDGSGYWETYLENITPGFHYHTYSVDGVETLNPIAPVGYGCGQAINYFEMPDPLFTDYYCKDVPHGSIRMEQYFSSVTGKMRACWVYTPPGYDGGDERYPVLYLQHGGGENECGWIWQGKIHYILDNLIAEGRSQKMLVVMNSGYAHVQEEDGSYTSLPMDEVIAKDCIPFIDAKFRTKAQREYRCAAGLSMGASHARNMAFYHRDLFASLAMFSCGAGFAIKGKDIMGIPYDFSDVFSTPAEYNASMLQTFITCGEQDPRHVFTKPQVEELRSLGYNVQYTSFLGYHEWDVWRKSAAALLPLLFAW